VKVTKYNRSLFQLAPSVRRTDETVYGLLPTPRVSETEGAPVKNAEWKNGSWSRMNQKGVRFGVKVKDVLASPGMKNGLKLHPHFVEWMMGFPEGWLDFPMEAVSPKASSATKASKHTVTR
jgi:hypothetical protein